MKPEESVLKSEQRLLTAIKNSDIITLDELIHDDLIFNLPTGQTITKEMDINNYRSGKFKVEEIEATDYVIKAFENCTVVSVMIYLSGFFGEQKVEGKFNYLRVWKYMNDSWKIIAGSGIQIE